MAKISKKQECDCCCCGDDQKEEKSLKVYICPKCRSNEVGYIFGLKNIFGIIPKMKCRKCGFELAGGFPQLVIPKSKLKNNKNRKKK